MPRWSRQKKGRAGRADAPRQRRQPLPPSRRRRRAAARGLPRGRQRERAALPAAPARSAGGGGDPPGRALGRPRLCLACARAGPRRAPDPLLHQPAAQALGADPARAANLRGLAGQEAAAEDARPAAAPPEPTAGSQRSAATVGCASAFATATPKRSLACSSARPWTTVTFGYSPAISRRNTHLRPFASISVTWRSGKATASGIPGAPPPEPTSMIGPKNRR